LNITRKTGFFVLLWDDLLGQMLADRFTFAVRVGGKIDSFAGLGGFLEVRNYFFIISLFCIGDHHVSGFEIVIDVYPEILGWKVLYVPDRRENRVILPQVFIDRFRLCRRFYYY